MLDIPFTLTLEKLVAYQTPGEEIFHEFNPEGERLDVHDCLYSLCIITNQAMCHPEEMNRMFDLFQVRAFIA